jgi:hypothetical protein
VGAGSTAVLSEPFGVGNAHYRTRRLTQPTLVDTVPYFACRRTLFDRFGFFDDSIPCSEDMVYNSHLRELGGRILLDPAIESWYQTRTDPTIHQTQPAMGLGNTSPLGVFPTDTRPLCPGVMVLALILLAAIRVAVVGALVITFPWRRVALR